MKTKLLNLIFFTAFFLSCSPSREIIKNKQLDSYWTLQSAPNSLDTVGSVFSIDSKGVLTRIPGGALSLKVVNKPIELPEQSKMKDVSFGAMISFLKIKNIDSGANIHGRDSTHVHAQFKISNGIISIPDDDLIAAFNKKSEIIAKNVKFLSLENQKLYLIMETISSNKINISFDRSYQQNIGASAKLKNLVKLNPEIRWSGNSTDDLVYDIKSPLVVFYHLRPININAIGNKGTDSAKIILSLGKKNIDQQELKY